MFDHQSHYIVFMQLNKISTSDSNCTLYSAPQLSTPHLSVVISSTPSTRAICNDPRVCGVQYTNSLRQACSDSLRALHRAEIFKGQESRTTVLHVLRGGLNFGLREALTSALGWNRHSSAFISAQRAQNPENLSEWFITEHTYKKVYLGVKNDLVFGDVVATGTSLEFALGQVIVPQSELTSITFFTIGGSRSHELISRIQAKIHAQTGHTPKALVVYFEGIFAITDPSTPLQIKLDGTDLVRRDAIMAPEFIASQSEDPAYPLERCTIYDAGSRAFHLSEYLEDVQDYWKKVGMLANNGVIYKGLLTERLPTLDQKRFGDVDLNTVVQTQLGRISQLLHH